MYPSVYVLKPVTKRGEAWIEENIDSEAMRWAGGVAIESRYLEPILEAILEADMKDDFELIS